MKVRSCQKYPLRGEKKYQGKVSSTVHNSRQKYQLKGEKQYKVKVRSNSLQKYPLRGEKYCNSRDPL